MKKKLLSVALCAAIALSLAPAASAAFSITSVRQGGVYYYLNPSTARPQIYLPTVPATPPAPAAPTAPATPDTDSGQAAAIVLTAFEARVVELVNQVRAQNGLRTLSVDLELTRIARLKSQDMRVKRYFDHQSPTYGSPFDMLRSFGVTYRAAGENIAMGYRTAELVMNGWMNSPSHRANLLTASYTHIGVGYADGDYWTQLFIAK